MPPPAGILLVLVALGALMAVATAVARAGRYPPEIPRKVVHVGMGLVCLSLPWLFAEARPVQVLALLAVVALGLVRATPRLREGPGRALHGVSRESYGEILFPVAVAVTFTLALAHGRREMFVIPLLLLTVADAAGALAGMRYGRTRYAAGGGFKSVEGSLSFFFLAFLCAHLVLLLATGTGRVESVLIAAILALLTMMVEAISTRGLDNFLIPVVGFHLLEVFLEMPAATLGVRFAVLALLLALVLAARRATTLGGAALLAAALFGYACFALGSWRFVLPPLGLFAAHIAVTRRLGVASALTHDVDEVAAVGISSLPWLLARAGGGLDPAPALAAFAAGIGAHVAMMHGGTVSWARGGSGAAQVLAGALLGTLVGIGPSLPWLGPSWAKAALWVAAGFVLIVLSAAGAAGLRRARGEVRARNVAPAERTAPGQDPPRRGTGVPTRPASAGGTIRGDPPFVAIKAGLAFLASAAALLTFEMLR